MATPRSIQALIGPSPRVIEDSVWAKLLWAGLNLTADDVPFYVSQSTGATKSPDPELSDKRIYYYPFEMVRAITLVWLFCALRSDEIIRLRVGCIRMQREDLEIGDLGEKESGKAQILEAKSNLQRMMQEIPLREEERAAVEDGLAALEKLTAKLTNVPTPAGPTPRELGATVRRELPILRGA